MLEQCERFEGDLAPLLTHPRRPPSRRALLTLALCDVAVEFWVAQRLLIRAGMHTAALALVRLHFEATVRAIWLHHGASDEWLDRFAAPMAPGQPRADARRLQGSDMAADELVCARWHPTRGAEPRGLHASATRRRAAHANGMALVTANLLVVALQDPALAGRIGPIQQAHQTHGWQTRSRPALDDARPHGNLNPRDAVVPTLIQEPP